MEIRNTDIEGVRILTPDCFQDHRGTFTKLFGTPELHQLLGARTIRQANRSVTRSPGMVRGIHYQLPPYAELKIVTCLRGRVFDVAVDLRKGSNTFLKWTTIELTSENCRMIVIPEGFGHGIQALEPNSEILYLCTADYVPAYETGVRYDDSTLRVKWPLEPQLLSERDLALPTIDAHYEGIPLSTEGCT